ncbi:MAG: YIP1 family protein [Bdellovibrionota bacterium]
MRDVSPNKKYGVDLNALIHFLIDYIKHPVQKISHLPDWNWSSLFVVHILLSIVSGVLAGLLKFNFYRVAFGLFLMPLVSTAAALTMSLFLYYYFQFIENRTENFRKIFTLVVLASIPFYLFQTISEYFSFVSIIGFAFASVLVIVGLCDNFSVEKKKAYKVVGVLFSLVLLTWISNKLT